MAHVQVPAIIIVHGREERPELLDLLLRHAAHDPQELRAADALDGLPAGASVKVPRHGEGRGEVKGSNILEVDFASKATMYNLD